MGIKLQVRRGMKQELPQLSPGEFGLCLDTMELFIGTMTGNLPVVLEDGAGDMLKAVYDPNNQELPLLPETGDGSNVTASFTEAEQDADIASGEKLTVLFGKIKKRFSVVNKLVNGAVYPNLGNNTNFLNPINQQGLSSYSAKNGSTLCIDRWILGSGGAYDVAARTLSVASYANRACGLWQTNDLKEHWLEIGSTITFSAYINGKYHSGTMTVLNRDSYSSFAAVPAGYTCDDFEVVCCTYAGNPVLYNLGIYAKKQLVINWVKWERGSAATPYALKTYPDELAVCQRYFNAFAIEVAPAYFLNGNIHYMPATLFPKRMRVIPTVDIVSAGVGNVGTVAASAVTVAMDVNGIREIIVNAGTSAYDAYNKLTLDMRISANY